MRARPVIEGLSATVSVVQPIHDPLQSQPLTKCTAVLPAATVMLSKRQLDALMAVVTHNLGDTYCDPRLTVINEVLLTPRASEERTGTSDAVLKSSFVKDSP